MSLPTHLLLLLFYLVFKSLFSFDAHIVTNVPEGGQKVMFSPEFSVSMEMLRA